MGSPNIDIRSSTIVPCLLTPVLIVLSKSSIDDQTARFGGPFLFAHRREHSDPLPLAGTAVEGACSPWGADVSEMRGRPIGVWSPDDEAHSCMREAASACRARRIRLSRTTPVVRLGD